jgi:hypothetical protein
MSIEAFKNLMDRWVKEPSFREELRRNPEETLRRFGVKLDDDEMVALRSLVMF